MEVDSQDEEATESSPPPATRSAPPPATRSAPPPAAPGRTEEQPPATTLCWTTELVDILFKLRYKKLKDAFKQARNKLELHGVWVGLAKELSNDREVTVTSIQCLNKMKALKRRWAEYKRDRQRTGNDVATKKADPQNLDVMLLYWGSSRGMDAESVFDDAHGRHHKDAEEAKEQTQIHKRHAVDGEDIASEHENLDETQGSKKTKITTAQAIEKGLDSLSSRMGSLGDAMASKVHVAAEMKELTEAIKQQQKEIHEQTQAMKTLVALLTDHVAGPAADRSI